MARVKFIRKTRSEISIYPIKDGNLLFETDQGNDSKVYMDYNSSRFVIGGKANIVDNLESTSTTDGLSANQGRVLAERTFQNGPDY